MRNTTALVLLITTATVRAGTITLEADGTGDYATIQAAVDNCTKGDVIVLNPGTYTGEGNYNVGLDWRTVTVRSAAPYDPCTVAATVIDCRGLGRAFLIYASHKEATVIDGLTISNGRHRDGGGIYAAGFVAIRNCVFIGNSADARGGALYVHESGSTITNCIFTGNSAANDPNGLGGGIYFQEGRNALVANCLFIGNSAGSAGAICTSNSTRVVTVANCTLFGNSATLDGGGILSLEASTKVTDCILWDNRAGDRTDQAAQIGRSMGELEVTFCCVENWTGDLGGEGNFGDDPQLIGGSGRLGPLSPCINAGDPDGFHTGQMDIDLQPRVFDGAVDIGCDEYIEGPTMIVWPDEMSIVATRTGSSEVRKAYVRNTGTGELNWRIVEQCDWLTTSPPQGASLGQADEIEFTVDWSALHSGDYDCEVQIVDSNCPNSPQVIAIRLNVGAIIVPRDYPTIQSAIDAARHGDVIIIEPNIYYETINFSGKDLTVQSLNPDDFRIVDSTVIDSLYSGSCVVFAGTESAECRLAGLRITGGSVTGYGGGIRGNGSLAAIENCMIDGCMAEGYGGAIATCNGRISNCLIRSNSVLGDGAALYDCDGEIVNCTIVENMNAWSGRAVVVNCGGAIRNCIFLGNKPLDMYRSSTPTYSCFADADGTGGNIAADPELGFRDGYRVPLSQAGRWDRSVQGWVYDEVTSPCIDAGDPNSDWTGELWPHGRRINMGYCGGTAQASMSESLVGNPADCDNDSAVDGNDLLMLTANWLDEGMPTAEDITRDGIVNFADFAKMAQNWLRRE